MNRDDKGIEWRVLLASALVGESRLQRASYSAFIGAPGPGPVVGAAFGPETLASSQNLEGRCQKEIVSGGPLHQQHLLCIVDLLELHFDNLAAARGDMLAHIGRFNRQLAMSAVDQHAKLHPARASVIE